MTPPGGMMISRKFLPVLVLALLGCEAEAASRGTKATLSSALTYQAAARAPTA